MNQPVDLTHDALQYVHNALLGQRDKIIVRMDEQLKRLEDPKLTSLERASIEHMHKINDVLRMEVEISLSHVREAMVIFSHLKPD